MKQVLALTILMMMASASYARTYKCYRHFNGHSAGTWVKVKADSKSEAEYKAYSKFKELGVRVDSVNCY